MRTLMMLPLVAIVLGAQIRPADLPFRMHRIDTGMSETVALADLNNDGRLDIISSESWYQAPTWTKRPLRTIPVTNGYVDNFSDLPVDVNGDGHIDLVQIAYFARRIVWLKNPGSTPGPWVETEIDAIGPTEFAFLVDLNNDGKAVELLPQFTGAANAGVTWYEIRNGAWVKHVVSAQSHGHGIGAGDLNGDGRTDIVTPAGWLEAPMNPGADGFWTFHATDWLTPQIAVGAPPNQTAPAAGTTAPPGRIEYGFMHVIDINKDGRKDILTTMAHSFGVLWIEQAAAGRWVPHLIDNRWSRAHASALADVNADDQPDLVTGTRLMGRNAQETEPLALYWYEFRASASGVAWVRHPISEGGEAGGGLQMVVADVGGDGDLDVVSGGKSGVFLAENLTKP